MMRSDIQLIITFRILNEYQRLSSRSGSQIITNFCLKLSMVNEKSNALFVPFKQIIRTKERTMRAYMYMIVHTANEMDKTIQMGQRKRSIEK